MPIELVDQPESPPHFEYVWEWFFEFGKDVTWAEIAAWNSIGNVNIERWEGDLLIRINHLRHNHE
jgi:hypothetical protein